ncbi:MAG: hypothetical protein RLY86_630 [Pseudomonadota bacterium]|jgi:UDP-N-acetylglucosamine 2-epimerase (non-hydrolysing)
MNIHLVAGARPNFMKVGPLFHALRRTTWANPVLVHTGQHFSPEMSDSFFADLQLPPPDHHLGIAGGSHAQSTGRIMMAYEDLCQAARPDWVVVVGDVNSTVAAAITAKKLHLPVAHLEAGLRSLDRTMPEEINRLLTDAISDLLWTPSPDADENLRREGVPEERIVNIGNIMLDAFESQRTRIAADGTAAGLGLATGAFAVVTLHRPANVDTTAALGSLIDAIAQVAARLPVVFPVHPRTAENLRRFGLDARFDAIPGLRRLPPLGYLAFMGLVTRSAAVITDSGGIQEETTYLGIPCFTLRPTTERPVTITHGTNRLVTPDSLPAALDEGLARNERPGEAAALPPLWDGRAAERAVASLAALVGQA